MISPRPFAVALALLTIGGCSSGGAGTSGPPPPDVRPVVDESPYWCEFVSRESFRRVTGLDRDYSEYKDSPWKTSGGCLLDAGKNPPLGVSWSAEGDNTRVLKTAHENWDDNNPTALPKELGEGLAVIAGNVERWALTGRPYYVISSFTCDGQDVWISIDVKQVQKGRDPIKDLIELMRVAQKRYGEFKDCTPKPPDSSGK